MTTREAIAITYAQAAKESGHIREALNLCAIITERHADRNRQNKRRQRSKARALSNVSEGCKEVARRMAEKDPGGGGLWRMRK